MIRAFILISILSQLCNAQSALRFIHSENRQNYQVPKLHIEVEVIHDLTYTTITAEFYNPHSVNQEGEMILPLPEGSSICEYQLEVNGEMKDASVVIKDRALKAYEEIKAKNIDPGIVEKKANNEFRIRVFPILPEKSKRMTISYVTRSKAMNRHYHYLLPIKLDEHVRTITSQIIAPHSTLKSKHFRINIAGDSTTLNGKNLIDSLSIKTPVAKVNSMIIQEKSGRKNQAVHVYYTTIIPDTVPLHKIYLPKKLTFIWNHSGYLDKELRDKQFALLNQYFKTNPNTNVQLYSVGYELKDHGNFNITAGNWSKMKKIITQLDYDGALDFNCVGAIKKQDLLNPVFVFFDTDKYQLLQWGQMRAKPHLIDLKASTIPLILNSITQQKLQPVISDDSLIGSFDIAEDSRNLSFVSKSPKGTAPMKQLWFTYEHETNSVYKASYHSPELKFQTRTAVLTHAIASHQLDKLTREKQSKSVITKFAIKHGLVSDYTSMIVLEMMSDYVKYEIRPADPRIQNEYDRLLKEKSPRISASYYAKKNFHSSKYPWHSYPFDRAIKNIEVWNDNLNRFFLPKQIDQKSRQHIMQWEKLVKTNEQSLQESMTQKEFIKRAKALEKLDNDRKKFFYIPNQFPKDKEIHVSLRGIVRDPKTHLIQPGMDLREFVLAEDAPLVDIYRNSQRITFNLDSKDYKKTPLQAGDMIVVRGENLRVSSPDRNFLKSSPYIYDPGTAIKAYTYVEDAWDSDSDGFGGDPFGDDGSSDLLDVIPEAAKPKAATLKGKARGLLKPEGNAKILAKQWQRLKDIVKRHPENAYSTYLDLRSNTPRDNRFYTNVAGVFYQQNLANLARRALSNIMAGEESSTVAQKRYLYWLMHFGDAEHALTFIKTVDPKLENPDFRFIKLTLLHSLNKLSKDEAIFLSRHLDHSFHIPLLTEKPIYDLRILASAESTGISEFIHIEFQPLDDSNLQLGRLSSHGLYRDAKDGIEEYTMKRMIPGTYQLKLSNNVIATYRIEIHSKNYDGTFTKKVITIHTDGLGGFKDLGKVDYRLP